MRFDFTALLWLTLATPPALAQTSSLLATPPAAPAPAYQFMHVNFSGSRIFFSPARQGKEWVKVKDYLGQSFTLFDDQKLGWEAMSRLLNELSAEGWELVQMLPDNNKDGNVGAVYLLRKAR